MSFPEDQTGLRRTLFPKSGRSLAGSGPQRLFAGALFVISAEFMFASMGASIRVAATDLPNEVIVFFRNLFGVALLMPWLARRGLGNLATEVPHLHLLRALAGLGAMYCFYYALAHIPLAEAMLLKMTAPLFIPFVALFMLSEAIPPRVLWAVSVGFFGVVLIVSPDPGSPDPVALIGLMGGCLAAVAKVTVRRLSYTEPVTRIVFYFAFVGALVSAIPLLWSWRMPALATFPWLLAVAVFATLGQLLMTRGFALASAGRLGVFTYFAVLFGAVYGWIFWQEIISWSSATGAGLVAVAGWMASRAKVARPR